jgi:hypothetical protein
VNATKIPSPTSDFGGSATDRYYLFAHVSTLILLTVRYSYPSVTVRYDIVSFSICVKPTGRTITEVNQEESERKRSYLRA